ncbi:MAG TPA: DNA polymerase III subunit beta [Burkholderiales bacterium]|nr:DNA polymerase III subunit beta [Burkholderiales bacterium]
MSAFKKGAAVKLREAQQLYGGPMKLETKLLREGLAFVKPAIRTNSGALAILQHVRLRAEGGSIILTASDLVAELEWRADVDAKEEADVCIPGQRLLAIAAAASDQIELKIGKESVSIASGAGRFRLPTLPGTDAPSMKIEGNPSAEGGWSEIGKEVDFADFAAPKDDTRNWIKGVNVRASGDAVEVTCTDGVGIIQGTLKGAAPPGLDVTIPTGYTAIAAHEALTKFQVFGQTLVLSGPGCAARLNCISDKFPDVSRILKAERKTVIRVKRADLLGALDLIEPMRAGADVLEFAMNGKALKLSLSGHDESAEATCPATVTGGEVSFGMKTRWLADVVKRAEENIELYWDGDPKTVTMFCQSKHRLMGAMPYRI